MSASQQNTPGRNVSAIVPARNEEDNLARVVRSLAGQPEVREIIVVDDQSTDGTPRVLETLGSQFPTLAAFRLDALPAGWVGKNYAVASGAARASGEWLLFTDADTDHAPGSLSEVLRRAKAAGADLISLSPGQEIRTWWEKAVIPRALVELARLFPFDKVSDPDSPVAAANGQYLLVRRAAYDHAGGHAAVSGEILEDVALAKRVKKSGGRILFLPGGPWVRTRMYSTFGAMWAGWTKNLYLLYGRSIRKILAGVAKLWLLDVAPIVLFFANLALALGGERRYEEIALGVTAAFCILMATLYGRRLVQLGFSRALAWYDVLGSALFGLLLLNSLRAYLWSGSIVWKGRRYPTGRAKEAMP